MSWTAESRDCRQPPSLGLDECWHPLICAAISSSSTPSSPVPGAMANACKCGLLWCVFTYLVDTCVRLSVRLFAGTCISAFSFFCDMVLCVSACVRFAPTTCCFLIRAHHNNRKSFKYNKIDLNFGAFLWKNDFVWIISSSHSCLCSCEHKWSERSN